jgi:FkbM family methyltransferase
MNYTYIKEFARYFGLYKNARWVNRHFLNRNELKKEKNEVSFYSQFIDKNDLVFDVGANYGEKTRYFLKLDARVISFEPQPDCMQELKSRCGNDNNLTTLEVALGSKPGTERLYISTHRGASSLVENRRSDVESTITISVSTLDEMILKYGLPKFIKIDVEGFEYEVLKGLHHSVPYISFEYNLRKNEIQKSIDCINYLAQFGNVFLNITPAENLVFTYPDWISKDLFIEHFLNDIPLKKGYDYGDIFAKIQTL